MRFKLFLGLALVTGMNLGCDSNSSSKSPGGEALPPPTPDDGTPAVEPPSANPGGLIGQGLSQAQLFRNLGDGIARKTVTFTQATAQLSQAIETFCSDPLVQDRAPAKAAWKDTMLLWEQFELFQVGPIAANEKALKTGIYGWTIVMNPCRVDEEVLRSSKTSPYTLPPNTNRKGLQAIEYLLYEESLASSCTTAFKRTWDALPLADRAQTRCSYLKALAVEVQGLATSVAEAWGTEGSNYLTSVIGNPAAEKEALQSLYENLFYLDIEVKNYKLASPAGHDPDFCSNSPAPCPGQDEFPQSRISWEAIRANITAFTDLIYGFEDANQIRPGGFAALVRSVGDDQVATRSEALTRELAGYFAAENEDLASLIAKQNQEDCEQSQISLLCQLRKSIKQISSDFKTEYSRLLSLTVPAGPLGDND